VPGELRVERLVRPRAERRRRLHPHQEVRDAAPPVADERRLVDDVDARAQRSERLLAGALPVAVLELDLGDGQPSLTELLEVSALVLEALPKDELGLIARRRRRGQLVARNLE